MKSAGDAVRRLLDAKSFASLVLFAAVAGMIASVALLVPIVRTELIEALGRYMQGRVPDPGVIHQRLHSVNFLCIAASAVCVTFLVSRNDRLHKSLELVLPLALVAVTLAFVAFTALRFGDYWLSSDSSSELLGARILASEHALFTRNFYYATEFWLVYRHPAAVALFMLIDDWAMVRALNIAAQLCMMLVAYGFMMRQARLEARYILLSMFLFLVPMSEDWWRDVLFEAYYNFFFTKIFLLMGFFLAATSARGVTGIGRALPAVLFLCMSLFTGLDGIRVIYNFSAPLVVATWLLFVVNPGDSGVVQRRLAVAGFGAAVIGFTVNSLVLSKTFHFARFGYGVARIDDFGGSFFDKLSQMIFGIYANFFGFRAADVFSVDGIFSGLSLLAAIAVAIAVTLCIRGMASGAHPAFRRLRNLGGPSFLGVYFASAVLFNIAFFQFMDGALGPRYLFAALMFVFPLTCVVPLMQGDLLPHRRMSSLLLAVVVLVCGNGLLVFHQQVSPDMDANAHRTGYLSYLQRNALDYGFASYWNANVTTELSGGTVDMVGLTDTASDPGRALKRYKWLSPTQFDDPLNHSGEAFLLLTQAELRAQLAQGRLPGVAPAYEDAYYAVIRYDSAAAIHRDVLGEVFRP